MASNGNGNRSSGGIGFFGLLFIAFLVLKLTNIIDWSWWWITAPLWGWYAIVIVMFIGLYAYHSIRDRR